MDTKIIGHTEGGYVKISIQCKEPPSNDKMEHIKQHIELLAREEIKTAQLQSTGTYSNYIILLCMSAWCSNTVLTITYNIEVHMHKSTNYLGL